MDIGAQLRAAREAKGLSISSLARIVRVQPRILAAIELNDVSSIPPRPFGRGFVRAYAEEVELDPERTVHEYFAQFPSTPAAAATPGTTLRKAGTSLQASSHWAGLGSAVAILLLIVAAAVVLGRRAGDATNESRAVGTSGAAPTTPADAAAPAKAPPPDPAPTNTPPAGSSPLTLTFDVSRTCWVTASADGQRLLYRLVEPGDRQTLTAARELTLRFGDAGAVAMALNGRQIAPLGGDGQIRDLLVTPETAASLR
jgi:cytoskeletal protein RodZ